MAQLWTAAFDWRFDGQSLLISAGTGPVEAMRALVDRADAVGGKEWLRAREDEIGVRRVIPGNGYVLVGSDKLWQEASDYVNGSDMRLAAAWEPEPAVPGTSVWVVEGETLQHGFALQGWGTTPEEALEGLLHTWAERYSPATEAEPGYLAEIKDKLRLHEIMVGQARAVRPEGFDLLSTNTCFDRTWAAYQTAYPSGTHQNASPGPGSR